jgi:hypothetical protein
VARQVLEAIAQRREEVFTDDVTRQVKISPSNFKSRRWSL